MPSLEALPMSGLSEMGIKDVWAHNMEDAFRDIRRLVQKFRFIAMDTEFPGVVARPIGEFRSTSDYQYQLLRCNVDLLKIIQLGITFMDDQGKTPPVFCYQFNFKFNLTEDMYAQDSIDLLQKSGIQFKKHEEEGIDVNAFAEALMTSGVVLSEQVRWLSFHSGYDFGYMLRMLTDMNLPEEEEDFFEILRIYFPSIYDVKYLMKSCKSLKGGLQEVADQLELERIGPQHQAGSDSLLTGAAFFRMRELFFEDNIDDTKYCGQLYGLGSSYIQNGANSTNAYSGQYNNDDASNGNSNNNGTGGSDASASSSTTSGTGSSAGTSAAVTITSAAGTTATHSTSSTSVTSNDSGHSNSATPPAVVSGS